MKASIMSSTSFGNASFRPWRQSRRKPYCRNCEMLLWSCGLHGANIVGGVMSPIWYGAMDETVSLSKPEKRSRTYLRRSF
ncbi:hypothetical protein PO124_15150 [Bacillus licheniformis]|nr:hypothetical protein [Bacillus licheniformis]